MVKIFQITACLDIQYSIVLSNQGLYQQGSIYSKISYNQSLVKISFKWINPDL